MFDQANDNNQPEIPGMGSLLGMALIPVLCACSVGFLAGVVTLFIGQLIALLVATLIWGVRRVRLMAALRHHERQVAAQRQRQRLALVEQEQLVSLRQRLARVRGPRIIVAS